MNFNKLLIIQFNIIILIINIQHDIVLVYGSTITRNGVCKKTISCEGTSASGNDAVAMGYATTASGLNAVALGFNTLAAGSITTALGSNTTATGDFGTSMGYSTIANCGATEPSNWQACVAMGFNINNTESESLAVSGNVHARNVKLFGNDERFKENITNANVETCLFNINKIRVVNYQLSKNVCKHQGFFMAKDMLDKCQQELIGITSQQVGSVLPNAIGSGISSLKLVDRSPSFNNNKSQEDQQEEILEDIHDVKGLDMNQIIAQLIGSIQTLSKQNEKLINRVNKLETMMMMMMKNHKL